MDQNNQENANNGATGENNTGAAGAQPAGDAANAGNDQHINIKVKSQVSYLRTTSLLFQTNY